MRGLWRGEGGGRVQILGGSRMVFRACQTKRDPVVGKFCRFRLVGEEGGFKDDFVSWDGGCV